MLRRHYIRRAILSGIVYVLSTMHVPGIEGAGEWGLGKRTRSKPATPHVQRGQEFW